tara:strand:- start:2624 stop:3403 length:780 start_codon:yes stop_codon:yes gene_type:complete
MTLSSPYLIFAIIMIPARYFVVAGLFFFLFYIIKKKVWFHLKIQKNFPLRKIIWMEIFFSVSTMIIFSAVSILIFKMYWSNYTLLYLDINKYGFGYFIFSTVLLLFIHDIYFYLTHRMIHHKKLYPIIHQVHHLSKNPTPWAAFSFHPIEAVIQIGFIPIAILLIPFHISCLAFWALYMMLFNVIGHLGFEFFPKDFVNTSIGKLFFTSTFHNMHHKKNNCNYGLYFIIWDRLFGTVHSSYQNSYNKFYHDAYLNKERK